MESIPASDTLTATDGAGVTPPVITRAVPWALDGRPRGGYGESALSNVLGGFFELRYTAQEIENRRHT